jgi:hypothetical protein
MNNVDIKIIKEMLTEKASRKSSNGVGIGKSITIRMPIIAHAKAISPYLEKLLNASNILDWNTTIKFTHYWNFQPF